MDIGCDTERKERRQRAAIHFMELIMELNMTSIVAAHYPAENAPIPFQIRTYALSLPAHSASESTWLDTIAYSIGSFMALAPLAIGTLSASVIG